MWEKKLQGHLSSVSEQEPVLPHQTSAAVLILFLPPQGEGQGHLVLTKRTTKVESHKGQMSFPGGYREKEDKTWLATALRETEEEIGIPSRQIQVLGKLDPVVAKGLITIIPFVGLLSIPHAFQMNPDEVEKIVLLPIEKLLEHGLKPVRAQESQYTVESIGITWEGELIWGATAKILQQIHQILREILGATF